MSSGTNNLANLARAGQLAAEPTSRAEIARLRKSADVPLRDSGNKSLSAAGRFMLAYNATHALAFAALRAEGYRPSASQGHRKVIFQVLEATAGAPRELWVALDRYHDRRNAAEYHGAPSATEAEATDLVELAARLQKLVIEQLRRTHADLLK